MVLSVAAPLPAAAEDAAQPTPSSAATEPAGKTIGGHVGVATPLLTVADETTSIADAITILNPIGISVHLNPEWTVDFETVVASPIDPDGSTGLIVDPGVVRHFGAVSAGLRIAWNVTANSGRANVGLIPLVNVGVADLGGAGWFVEAAFPTFYEAGDVAFNTVFHTGVGF